MEYRAPFWLKNPHAQTIWPLAIKGPRPKMRRKRWETPDGDFLDVDMLARQEDRPLVVLFHGLEGSSSSHYARSFMRAAKERGWNGAVVHFRGCSGEPNRLARSYHSGDTTDIDWILRKLANRYPRVPRYAVGVSLGGNALLCWLAEQREQAHKLVTKAAAISAPMDLTSAGNALERGFNKRVYARYFLHSMRRTAKRKAKQYGEAFDADRAGQATTLRDFDDAYTAPVHGFHDVNDYWRRASAKPAMGHIALPTLVLNARNDPFVPAQSLPQRTDVSPTVLLEQPDEGGHVGFVTGAFPGNLSWLPERVLTFFEHR